MYNTNMPGQLFIVSTPIGNLQDITLRAITTLKEVDLVVCEDTRVTGRLLHEFQIDKKMITLTDANEESKSYEIIQQLLEGIHVALVSDSGTPLISDPGFKLVREAIKKEIQVVPIPGANAITTALSASGFPTDKFLFLGFAPDSLEHKKKFLENAKNMVVSGSINPTFVYYESPHKLLRSLEAIQLVFGDIEIVVAREMTKMYEEFLRNKVSVLTEHFTKNSIKGEFVILFRVELS